MWREKFDTVINFNGRDFRYNSKECILEYLAMTDIVFTDSGFDLVKLDKPKVIDCIGLRKENAEADLMGYIHGWNMDLQEELEHEMKFL